MNIATNATEATDYADTCENTGDNVTLPNKMPNKDIDHGIVDTGQDTLIEPNDFRVPTENLDADTTSKVDKVTPTNNDESVEEGLNLPDLGSKQPEPKPQAASMIDLPEEVVDEVHVDFGHDELALDFLDNEIDNATVLGVNAAPVADFAKEMTEEEGVDRDLELELQNLTFLEEQNSKQKRKEKNLGNKNNRKKPKGGKPKGHRKQSNIMPNNTNNTKSTSDTTPALLQPLRDLQRVSGRQPNMAYVKTMDPAIHRIMDVKSVDNFYHCEVNLMITTGAITLCFYALYAKRHSVVPTHEIDISIHTT